MTMPAEAGSIVTTDYATGGLQPGAIVKNVLGILPGPE